MAKISRSPYHGSRYVKNIIGKDTNLNLNYSGNALFVDVPAEGLTLSLSYLASGAYHKIIIRESLGELTISADDLSGMILFDVGGAQDSVQSVLADSSNSVIVPAGVSDGSIFDVICDGDRWYIQGMLHGQQITVQ